MNRPWSHMYIRTYIHTFVCSTQVCNEYAGLWMYLWQYDFSMILVIHMYIHTRICMHTYYIHYVCIAHLYNTKVRTYCTCTLSSVLAALMLTMSSFLCFSRSGRSSLTTSLQGDRKGGGGGGGKRGGGREREGGMWGVCVCVCV